MCRRGAGAGPEEHCGKRGTSRVRAALGIAGDGGAGVSASDEGRHAGNGSCESGRPVNQDSRKQTSPRGGREVRTDGMAHESHTASHAKALPADLGTPPFVSAWQMRALVVGATFSLVALILTFMGQAQDQLGWDHFLRALGSGHDAHLRLVGRWAGLADGAVLLRRQMGPAAAPPT